MGREQLHAQLLFGFRRSLDCLPPHAVEGINLLLLALLDQLLGLVCILPHRLPLFLGGLVLPLRLGYTALGLAEGVDHLANALALLDAARLPQCVGYGRVPCRGRVGEPLLPRPLRTFRLVVQGKVSIALGGPRLIGHGADAMIILDVVLFTEVKSFVEHVVVLAEVVVRAVIAIIAVVVVGAARLVAAERTGPLARLQPADKAMGVHRRAAARQAEVNGRAEGLEADAAGCDLRGGGLHRDLRGGGLLTLRVPATPRASGL